MKKRILSILIAFMLVLTISPVNPQNQTAITVSAAVKLSNIPNYKNKAYYVINKNKPSFTKKQKKKTKTFEKYSNLDKYGRTKVAFACLGEETQPKENEERGSISNIYPSGWKQKKYKFIPGKYLYHRCHLIGWQLSAENANEKNLITGTQYFNVEGMLPFEEKVDDYIDETDNHVLYRVTPIYKGEELLCRGVQLEAWSVEDKGKGIKINVFIYNVQPKVKIVYKTGESSKKNDDNNKNDNTNKTIYVYRTPTGKKYHLIKTCGGSNSYKVTLKKAKSAGLTPCSKCAS